jgi:hypothetical protein
LGVRVRGNGEVPLARVLADPRTRDAGEVQQRDPAVAKIDASSMQGASTLLYASGPTSRRDRSH